MNEEKLPGIPNPNQKRIGFVLFFLVAGLVAFLVDLNKTDIDPFNTRGPEVVGQIGIGTFALICGKAILISLVSGSLGSWGFSYPRLYLIGTFGGIFAIVGGPVLYGSVNNFFWRTTLGPVVVILSALSFALAFFIMMGEIAKKHHNSS